MRKIVSTIAATVIVASAFSTFSISASASDKPEKGFIINTKALVKDLELESGYTIPKGTVALTLRINNSTSFTSSAFKLDIDNSDILIDENNKPLIEKGELLNNSHISIASKDNSIVVASASAKETTGSGEMFTIFLSNDTKDISVYDISSSSICLEREDTKSTLNNRGTLYQFYIGDVNHNFYINSSDASAVYRAYSLYCDSSYLPESGLPINIANQHLDDYFPNVHYAEAADTNKNGLINDDDGDNILDFYSLVSVGYTWEEAQNILSSNGNYCGELELRIE